MDKLQALRTRSAPSATLTTLTGGGPRARDPRRAPARAANVGGPKMFRKVVLALVAIIVLATPFTPPVLLAQQGAETEQKKDCTVYVTRTGHRYHRAGCSYLRRSQIPMLRSEAIKRRLAPCKRC